MADYSYTSGDGIAKLSSSTPDGDAEAVLVLDDAIRQIKAYLIDLDFDSRVDALETLTASLETSVDGKAEKYEVDIKTGVSGSSAVSGNLDLSTDFPNAKTVQLLIAVSVSGLNPSTSGKASISLVVGASNYGDVVEAYWNTAGGAGEDSDTIALLVDVSVTKTISYNISTTASLGNSILAWSIKPLGSF